MLLLYPTPHSPVRTDPLIYIPLCFYFIWILQPPQYRFLIYIPLCFYFICSTAPAKNIAVNLHSTMLLLYPFSPHRAAIKCLYLHSTMLLLYRIWGGCMTEFIMYLHSTMLLLYPGSADAIGKRFSIYIPLCFYFIKIGHDNHWFAKHIYIPLCFYFIWTAKEKSL